MCVGEREREGVWLRETERERETDRQTDRDRVSERWSERVSEGQKRERERNAFICCAQACHKVRLHHRTLQSSRRLLVVRVVCRIQGWC